MSSDGFLQSLDGDYSVKTRPFQLHPVRLYSGTSTDFIADSVHNRIADKLKLAYFATYRREPPRSEIGSWRNSLRAMSQVFEAGHFHDHGVLLEYELPLSSRRLDCLITGRNEQLRDNAVIVELKQWEACREGDGENVVTFVAGDDRDVLHPSAQVGRYKTYLEDAQPVFHEASDPIVLAACSYLHNYQIQPGDPLLAPKFKDLVADFPLYSGDDVEALTQFLYPRLARGQGMHALHRIEASKYRASKKLLDHVGGLLTGRAEYVLLDEQLVAFNRVLTEAKAGFADRRKSAIVIRGGPGTGKSVIALNLLAELSRLGLNAHYVTGSRAFTNTLKAIVGSRAASQLKFFNSYSAAEHHIVDVMICDEAHRIRETSNHRFTPAAKRSGKAQLDELFHAAKVTVFFIDDRQVVRPGEIGSANTILAGAGRSNCRIFDYKLEAQFRCSGSDAFVNWVDNTLEVERTANVLWNVEDKYDFRIMDSPEQLERSVREKVAEGHTARMVAGFCWPWSKSQRDGTLVNDVIVGDFSRPWNANPESARLAPEIPPPNLWAHDPRGIGQVGCIYTAQGFEFDYVGIIFGPDLVYRHGTGWIGNPACSHDTVVKRSKDTFLALVKNTYRVLFTRGLKGFYVHFMDAETRQFFTSRTERPYPETEEGQDPLAAEE